MFKFKIVTLFLLFSFFGAQFYFSTNIAEANSPKKLNKYKKCRLKCFDKHDKCETKADKKKKSIRANVVCMSKKNVCLEKCSDHIN
ncbi:hypothetical protein BVY03_04145 [bacterium K02(2017)]|nr:hypothetical protein BVY03_04145 [bacterium K02(2017)]